MGKGGGGGGGGSTQIKPTGIVSVNQPDVNYSINQAMGLSDWLSRFLGSDMNLSNWATNIATGGAPGTQAAVSAQDWALGKTATRPGATQTYGGVQSGSLIDQVLQTILQERAATGQIAPIQQNLQALYGQETGQAGWDWTTGQQLLGQGQDMVGQGEQMLQQATTGTGLYPSQQAMIDAQVNAAQNQMRQNLGTMGLGTSTMGAELGGQIGLQGAATAGQLVQQNIAAAQQQQQLGLSQEQVAQQQFQLGAAMQQIAQGNLQLQGGLAETYFNELGKIATQYQGLQAQAWSEAMQSKAVVSQLLQNIAQFEEVQLGGEQQFLQASEANANVSVNQASINAGVQERNQQAQQQGMSGLFQGLGSLFGGGGGGGGLGGLFGGGAAGGAIDALGTLGDEGLIGSMGLGGLGSGIGGALSAIGGTAIGGTTIGGIASALTAAF